MAKRQPSVVLPPVADSSILFDFTSKIREIGHTGGYEQITILVGLLGKVIVKGRMPNGQIDIVTMDLPQKGRKQND